MTRGRSRADLLESALREHVERAKGVSLANEQVNVAHRAQSRVRVDEVRERGTLQDEEWHARLLHRAADLFNDPRPNCRRVCVPRAARRETSPEMIRNGEPCLLDMREHERLHA